MNALARAHRWKRLLREGRYASIGEMAVAERIDRGYLGRILQLMLLAPDIVEAALDERQQHGLGLPTLLSMHTRNKAARRDAPASLPWLMRSPPAFRTSEIGTGVTR